MTENTNPMYGKIKPKISGEHNTMVRTGVVRLSFPNILAPQKTDDGNEKYGASLLFPEDSPTDKAIKQAIQAAIKEGSAGIWAGRAPKKPALTYADGNDTDYAGYEDMMFIRCSSNSKPGAVMKAPAGYPGKLKPIDSEEDLYAGCYVIATIRIAPYDYKGKKGITAYIDNIMKFSDGERFGGGQTAEQAFGDDDLLDLIPDGDEDLFGDDGDVDDFLS